MVVHIGFISLSSDLRGRQEGEMVGGSKSLCCGVHYWIKIMALECIMGVQGYCMVVHIGLCSGLYMDCLQLLHGSVHWSIEDCCIEMHDGLFTITA